MILKASRRVVIEVTKGDLVAMLKSTYPMDIHIQGLRADASINLEIVSIQSSTSSPSAGIRLTSNSVPKDLEPNASTPDNAA